MTRMTRQMRFPRTASWLFGGLLAIGSSAAWAQTLTLQVPSRGPSPPTMQTAMSAIEFDAASIGGGSTISVDGTSIAVADAGCAGVACKAVGVSPTGDVATVTRISGTQRARLDISYKSVFPGNFCAPTITPAGLSITLELTGFTFGAGKGYRITSFMAPSDASCDIAYVRVPTSRPSISGAGADYLGRLPLNIVLVIDKSPSMDWVIPGSPDKRWDRMKSSVQLFASVWDAVGAPPPPATISSEGHPDDRLGMVLFGGTAVESNLDGLNFFKQRGAIAAPWAVPVAAGLADNTYIGGTSIGAGTTMGRARLVPVEQLVGDTAIVLFTDGEQNNPPCISRQGEVLAPVEKPYPGKPPGTTYLDKCAVAAAMPSSALLTLNGGILARDVLPRGPIFTIGLGEGGMAASAELLDEISGETAGRSAFPNNGVAMDNSFVDNLVTHLKGGTVSLLDRTLGDLAAGTPASTPFNFIVDPSLTRVTFVLSWEGSAREAGLEIRRPDGTMTTAIHNAAGPNFRVATVNIPQAGPAGDWKVTVRQFGTAGLKYQLSAYGVESRLGARVTETPRLGTASPIGVVAEVGWEHGPLADLPAGAIRAIIERPGANLGTLLHDAGAQPIDGEIRNDTSPLSMKLDQLIRTAGLLDKIEPKPVGEAIELKHVGNGRYEGKFDATNVGGRYRIRIEYDWNDPRTGTIRRRDLAERQVPVIPTAKDSAVRVQREPRSANAVIVITPRDKFGNYVGPGYEGGFNVKIDAGTIAGAPTDNGLTGEYTIKVGGLAPGDDPKVSIVFADQVLRDGPLSSLGTGTEPPSHEPWWKRWWWLILILLLLVLFLLLRRK